MSLTRRTPLRRTPFRSKPKPRPGLAEARAQVERRAFGMCEANTPSCTWAGHHAHHVVRRSQGGADDPSNLLWVCAACHGWIHANPAASKAKGWLG